MPIPKTTPEGFTRTWCVCVHQKESSEPQEPAWKPEKLPCQRVCFLSHQLAGETTRKYKASPEGLHFILKTILKAAFDIQGLRDTKMTHKSVVLKPKGEDIQGS